VEQTARGVYNFLLEEEPTALDATDLSQAAEDLQRGPITSFFIIANVNNLHPILPVKSKIDRRRSEGSTTCGNTTSSPSTLIYFGTTTSSSPNRPPFYFVSPETNTSSPTIQGTAGGTSGTSSPRTSKATSSTPKETSKSTKTSTYRKLPSIALPMSALQGRL
jgi:hypothetical protein